MLPGRTQCVMTVSSSVRRRAVGVALPLQPARGESGLRDETHALSVELGPDDELIPLEVQRGDVTVHNERIIHGSGGNRTDGWRRTYVVAFRSAATVAYERSIGFTHSHNDTIRWETHLAALER